MTTIYIKNALSQDVVDELIEIYDSADEYDTATMKKADGLSAMP